MRSRSIARLLFLVATMLIALPGWASADDDPVVPAVAPPSLMRIASDARHDQVPQRVAFDLGRVELTAAGTRWLFDYLPMSPMLSGSYNYGRGFGHDLPDPFVLTGTQLATPPRLWQDGVPRDFTFDLGSRAHLTIGAGHH